MIVSVIVRHVNFFEAIREQLLLRAVDSIILLSVVVIHFNLDLTSINDLFVTGRCSSGSSSSSSSTQKNILTKGSSLCFIQKSWLFFLWLGSSSTINFFRRHLDEASEIDLSPVVLEQLEVVPLLPSSDVLVTFDALLHALLLGNRLLLDGLDVLRQVQLLALFGRESIRIDFCVASDSLENFLLNLLLSLVQVLLRYLLHDLIDCLEFLLSLELEHLSLGNLFNLGSASLVNDH